jgi:hypothetical protein
MYIRVGRFLLKKYFELENPRNIYRKQGENFAKNIVSGFWISRISCASLVVIPGKAFRDAKHS